MTEKLFSDINRYEGIEYDICLRQLAVKSPDEKSWFNRIRDLLYRYDLPSPSVLLEQPLSKSKWKSMIDNAIHAEVEGTWREDIQLKSSLKYINVERGYTAEELTEVYQP